MRDSWHSYLIQRDKIFSYDNNKTSLKIKNTVRNPAISPNTEGG